LGTDRTRYLALLGAEKNILELDHARIGEQEGRVIGRHQRTGGHGFVIPTGKIVNKQLSNFSSGFQ
jgi:hypothetical protein